MIGPGSDKNEELFRIAISLKRKSGWLQIIFYLCPENWEEH